MGGAHGVSEAPYGGTFTLECGLDPMEPSSMVLANTAWSVVRLFPWGRPSSATKLGKGRMTGLIL